MRYRLIITTEARSDMLAAYNYYEDILPGLGEDFLQVLTAQYNALTENPFLYSYINNRKTLRDVKLARFPYVLIFEIVGQTVVVFAVHNTYKKPR